MQAERNTHTRIKLQVDEPALLNPELHSQRRSAALQVLHIDAVTVGAAGLRPLAEDFQQAFTLFVFDVLVATAGRREMGLQRVVTLEHLCRKPAG